MPGRLAFVSLVMFSIAVPAQETDWVREIAVRAPSGTCAIAAVQLGPDALQKMVMAALPVWLRELIDDQLARSGNFKDTADLLRQLGAVLGDRVAIVVRRNEPDPGIPVARPGPQPQFACLFSLRPGADTAPVQRLTTTLQKSGLFQKVYRLDIAPGPDQAVMEFCNPMIPATGEVATWLGARQFAVSNSGPLLKDLVRAAQKDRSQLSEAVASLSLSLPDPAKGRGVLLFRVAELEAIFAKYDSFSAEAAAEADPMWAQTNRAAAEASVLKKVFPKVSGPGEVPQEARAAFDELVRLRLLQQWNEISRLPGEPFQLLRGMLRLFPSGVGHMQFEQESIALVLMRLFGP